MEVPKFVSVLTKNIMMETEEMWEKHREEITFLQPEEVNVQGMC